MRRITTILFVTGVTLFPPASLVKAQHSNQTLYGHITALQTGSLSRPAGLALPKPILADDTIIVALDVPFVNSTYSQPGVLHPTPTLCKVQNLYALNPSDTGIKLNEAALLSAHLAGRRVSLVVDGCVFDMPRIVSVNLLSSSP
jgi:hypothetical protein